MNKEQISKWLYDYLFNLGIQENLIKFLKILFLIIIITLISILVYIICKKVLLRTISIYVKKTKYKWDDILFEKKVFSNISHIFPALIIQWTIPLIFYDFPVLIPFFLKLTYIYITVVIVLVLYSFLNALKHYLSELKIFKDKPIESYIQISKLIIFIIAVISLLSLLLNKPPLYFLSALGAMTAVLLLVFKDTILGFVASVQISANDLLRIGDWVEMPKFGADGDVIEINLTTVKIRNWDKTISTVPTYAFISDSFKNWRGINIEGARRIKRSMFIDLNSIKFCNDKMIEKFKKIHILNDYITSKEKEIKTYNQENKINKELLINGRHLTNIGVFRKYVELYLQNNNNIRKDMTLMVRQLQVTEKGLPLEVYCFSKDIVWVNYENIISDIFDHIFASLQVFELHAYQFPSSKDLTSFKVVDK